MDGYAKPREIQTIDIEEIDRLSALQVDDCCSPPSDALFPALSLNPTPPAPVIIAVRISSCQSSISSFLVSTSARYSRSLPQAILSRSSSLLLLSLLRLLLPLPLPLCFVLHYRRVYCRRWFRGKIDNKPTLLATFRSNTMMWRRWTLSMADCLDRGMR